MIDFLSTKIIQIHTLSIHTLLPLTIAYQAQAKYRICSRASADPQKILSIIVRGLSFLVQFLEGDGLWHERRATSVRLSVAARAIPREAS